jgi:adenosylhomocysteine nucleosidase
MSETGIMRVGILAAMPEERVYFGDHLKVEDSVTAAGLRFDLGTLDGRPVALVESGIGKVNAALAATLLCEKFGCGALLFSGVAGGLDPALGVGDLVIATSVVQHDYGSLRGERIEAYRPGALPTMPATEPPELDADPQLIEQARAALAGLEPTWFGRILTGDAYLACAATRDRLRAMLGGLAIDMESAAVAQIAAAYGARWLIVRALSDLAGEDSHLDFHEFIDRAARTAAAAVLRLVPVAAGQDR